MAGLGLDFAGALFSGGDIGESLISNISGGQPEKIFGKKPEVSPYVPIDLGEEIGKSVTADLENLTSVKALLDKTIPNFSDLISTGTANALALSRGELPAADQAALMRTSAFKSLQGGFGGTQMGRALTLRDLGIGTLQANQAGANLGQQMTQLAEGAYSPFLISTGQQAGTTAANRAGQQATQQFEFNVAAAPTPASLGHFLLDKSIGDQFMSFGMGAAGGAIAGAGGAAMGGGQQPGYGGGYPQGSTYQPFDWRQNAMGSSSGSSYYYQPTWQPGT